MNYKKFFILSGLTIFLMSTSQIVLAEETVVVPTDSVVITSNQDSVSLIESQMQWAWGEVVDLDNQVKTVTLKYLDYDTDQEKVLVLLVDEKTVFENIQDFNALKLKDTLSIDYIVGEGSKNIAKNINFEQPDIPAAAVLTQTAVVDLVQQAVQLEAPVDSAIVTEATPIPVESASLPSEPAPAVLGETQ